MAGTVKGGCLCGAVRYEVSADPVMSEHCYCRDCQRVTGAETGFPELKKWKAEPIVEPAERSMALIAHAS